MCGNSSRHTSLLTADGRGVGRPSSDSPFESDQKAAVPAHSLRRWSSSGEDPAVLPGGFSRSWEQRRAGSSHHT